MIFPFELLLFAGAIAAKGSSPQKADIALVVDMADDAFSNITTQLRDTAWSSKVGDIPVNWNYLDSTSPLLVASSMPTGTIGIPKLKYKKAIDMVDKGGSPTSSHNSMEHAKAFLKNRKSEGHPFVLLISDGKNINENKKATATTLKSDGVKIFSIRAGGSARDDGLEQMSSPGLSFAAFENGQLSQTKMEEAFEKIKEQVAAEVEADSKRDDCPKKADVVLVMESSTKIPGHSLNTFKKKLQGLVRPVMYGDVHIRWAYALCDHDATTVLKFTDHQKSPVNALAQLVHKHDGHYPYKGLRKAEHLIRTSGQKDSKKYILYITSGHKHINDKVRAEVKKLKALGVVSVCIAVGHKINMRGLKKICPPHHIYHATQHGKFSGKKLGDDFHKFKNIVKKQCDS